MSEKRKKLNGKTKIALSSGIGSLTSTLILNPILVAKVKMQISSNNSTIASVIKNIYEQKGMKGFWSGAGAGELY